MSPMAGLRDGRRSASRTRLFAWAAIRAATQRGGSLKSDAARTVRPDRIMKAVPKASHTDGRVLARFDRNVETHRQARPHGTYLGRHDRGEKRSRRASAIAHTDAPTGFASRTRSGARARKDHVRLRRPAARKETGAQDRQANPDPPAIGKAPRTWCVCQWPNEVHASTLRPRQGGVCPPPSLQGASTLQQRGSDASTHTDNGDDDDTGQDDG
jgi:hypothetical protein